MYYKKTPHVPVPEDSEHGKIIVAATGYVYLQVNYTWDKEKRQPHYVRKTLGRLDKDHPGMMYYSPDYEAYFGPVLQERSEVQKRYGSRWLQEAGDRNLSQSFGPFAVIRTACEKTGCLQALQAVFRREWSLMLGLCIHAVADRQSEVQRFSGWCFCNYSGLNRTLLDTDVPELYESIRMQGERVKVFLSEYQKAYHSIFRQAGGAVEIALHMPVYSEEIGTETSSSGMVMPDPIMIVCVDQQTGIPLGYEIVETLDGKFSSFREPDGTDPGPLMMIGPEAYDEKMISEATIKSSREFGFLCPAETKYGDQLIQENGADIQEDPQCFIPEANVFGKVFEVQTTPDGKKAETMWAYLFYEKGQAGDEPGEEEETKEQAQDSERSEDSTGFTVMMSTAKMLPADAIRMIRIHEITRERMTEMMRHFRFRGRHGNRRDHLEGTFFLSFLSAVCQSAFEYYECEGQNAVFSSSETAQQMQELRKYQIIYNREADRWEPVYAMNKVQTEIFKALGLKEGDVQLRVTEAGMEEPVTLEMERNMQKIRDIL